MHKILLIPATLNIVTNCWKEAEAELRGGIEKKYHDLDEEFITRLFYGEFAYSLNQASGKGLIRRAFLIDLQNAFPKLRNSRELNAIPNALIAEVSLHKREVERITGGDFGLTIIRPQVFSPPYNKHELWIEQYEQGLLCQAKIKRRNGKFGKLTKKQKEVLPGRMDYLSLLLYSYKDDPNRCQLNEFCWQLCKNASIESAEEWLKLSNFPNTITSEKIIKDLGSGLIGTHDREIIKNIIRSKDKPNIIIRIFWPPDKHPRNRIHIYSSQNTVTEEKITMNRR
jgi:hypothetical protein